MSKANDFNIFHNKNKRTIYCSADFETTHIKHGEPRVFIAGVKIFKRPHKDIDRYYFSYENLSDFLDIFYQYQQEHKYVQLFRCYFHNLAFDGSYLLTYLINNGYKQTLKKGLFGHPILKGKTFTTFISKGKWFSMSLKWRGVKIEFFDSYKLGANSLEKIGQVLGLEKLKDTINYEDFKLDPNHNYPQLGVDYLKRDLLIVETLLKKLAENVGLRNQLTISSLAFSKIKQTLKANEVECNYFGYKYFYPFYNGGLCLGNNQLQGKGILAPKQIKVIDANSMYPSQMIKKLPYGPPLKEPPSGDYCCFITVNITRLKQKKYHEITFFPRMYQYDSETLGKKRGYHISETFKIPYIQSFDKGNYTYHFLESEFNLYKKAFEIDYEVMDRIYFQTSNYLKDDIETLYKAKQTAIDEIQQTNAKLILNSIYGKMATRPTAEMLFFGDENEINQDEYTIKKKNEKLQLANFPCFGLTKKLTNESKTKPIFIASAITAMARVDLLKMIFKMIDHGNRFLYADTDSVIYIENKKVKYPNKDNLGNWKLEKEGDGFKYLAPKTYRLCEEGNEYPIKSASGGLNVDISKQIKNKDYNYQIVAKRIVKKYGQYGINLIENYFNYDKYKDKISEDICPKSLRK